MTRDRSLRSGPSWELHALRRITLGGSRNDLSFTGRRGCRSVIALLPAHNNADHVAVAVTGLRAQGVPRERTIVICHNCSDDTASADLARAEAWESIGNTGRTASARNQTIDHRIADAQPLVRRDDAVMEHPLTARAALPAPASVSTLDGAFALIRIPRFGAGYIRPVVEGTDAQDLKEGVGHYRGTAAPGQRGNFAVAGHRTTYGEPFHLIAELRPGDRIIVRTRAHTFVYRVVSHQVVSPADVQVIAADPPGMRPGYLMTLTSCHPMYLASQRYVVHARLLSTT